MTKEQAIEELTEINLSSIHEKTIMATNMAIEAILLQDEYFTKMDAIRRAYDNISKVGLCEDCISRQAVKEALRNRMGESISECINALPSVIPKQNVCDDAISRSEAIRIASGYCHWTNIPDELAKLPSVSTEKIGRWNKKYDSIVNDYFWECDICKCGFQRDYPYCPNCGAKMEGVEE